MIAAALAMTMGTAWAAGGHVEGYAQALPSGDVGAGAGVGLDAGMLFANVEARSSMEGIWLGRATGGLDVFGGSEAIDATVGVFAGAGGWGSSTTEQVGATGGVELGLGGRLGVVHARFRHVQGLFGPMQARFHEEEFRLGVALGEDLEVFGQYVLTGPEPVRSTGGFGAGLALRF